MNHDILVFDRMFVHVQQLCDGLVRHLPAQGANMLGKLFVYRVILVHPLQPLHSTCWICYDGNTVEGGASLREDVLQQADSRSGASLFSSKEFYGQRATL